VRFAQPLGFAALALVPILAALWVWSVRRRRRDLRRFLGPDLAGRLAAGASLERQAVKGILAAAGLAFLALSLARPQWGLRVEPVVRRGMDVIVALDASDSMLAEDLRPSRLARAKAAAAELIERLPLDRVGIVSFAGAAEVECPLTPDHEAARMFIDAIDPSRAAVAGTMLGEALRVSLSAFSRKERKYRAIVLITDGEDHEEGAVRAAAAAAEQGVLVYTVGVGSARGEPVPVRAADGALVGYKKDEEGRVVTSRLDEALLAEMARAGRGRYYRLSGDQQEVAALAGDLASLERREVESGVQSRLEDRYQLPLAAAVLVLGAEALVAERRRRREAWRGRFACLAILALTSVTTAPALAASPRRLNEEGNRAYRNADFDAALRAYTEAQVGAPGSPAIQYNIGNVFYRQEDYERAAEAYRKALEGARGGQARDAAYNLGNSRFLAGDFGGAVEAYRGALEIDPRDRDAKRNLEIALARLKPPPPPKGGGSQDKKDDQKKDQQREPSTSPQPRAGQRNEQPQPREGELGREEAERLLDALAQEERQNLDKEKRPARAPAAGGKDW
jgi:Ca-activated chloride channel family protein